MILHRLIIENFRQFRGRQEVNLLDVTHPERNVIVIFGENGSGKTGLFRAVVFCLFGERRLSQDGDVPDNELQLVNASVLQENPDQPVRTSVELEFSHNERLYVLTRAMSGMLDHDKLLEEMTEVGLLVTGPDGNTGRVTPADIQPTINAIMDPRVRDYFLFDGEQIERLTRATVEQRQEISKGIRNLLHVDALEMAIRATRKLSGVLDKELSQSSSEDLVRLLSRLRENETKQGSAGERLQRLAQEIGLARKEIRETDRELDKFSEIRHLVERRKALEQELRSREQQAAEILAEMRNHVTNAAALILSPTINKVFLHFEHQRQKGDIPSEIRRDLIDRILEEGQCICGRALCQGSDEYHRILSWRERTPEQSIQNAALNLWRYLGDVVQRMPDHSVSIEKRLLQYGNAKNAIVSTQRNLEQLRDQIGSSEREDASKLDAHRTNLERKTIELEAQAISVQSSLSDLQREEERLRALLREEKMKAARTDELTRRSILARDTLDALNEVHSQFTQEIRFVIGRSASELLSVLLDDAGRENLRSVVVNEDYSLQVLDRWKRPFLANISAGQRQVLSLAFIGALAKEAAQSAYISMPLFMDTPFGRLSYEHRKNLVAQLPGIASQWILLATDTEFRRAEAALLRSGQRWARFYMLRTVAGGNTIVEEHSLESAIALLRTEEHYQ